MTLCLAANETLIINYYFGRSETHAFTGRKSIMYFTMQKKKKYQKITKIIRNSFFHHHLFRMYFHPRFEVVKISVWC